MRRLQALGNKYNAAEGIIVMWKGRVMKFTGSFAAINQALRTRFMIDLFMSSADFAISI